MAKAKSKGQRTANDMGGDQGLAVVRLAAGRDKAVRQGHPWIFSGAVASVGGDERATLAVVEDAAGKRLGVGFFNPQSQIRVRMLQRFRGGGGEGEKLGAIDRSFFAARLAEAVTLRNGVVPPQTTGYRLLNAEGDGVPGWTVDRFGDVLVSQITVAGLEAVRDEAYAALVDLFPEATILQSNALAPRRAEGLPQADEAIRGEAPVAAKFEESGLTFAAEVGGQKTGFYLDQRPNRRLAEELAAGRRLLDLFAHGGAFAAYALRGGALDAVAVESAPRLLESGREQLAWNGLDGERVEWVKANVFEDLRERRDRYGLVVCDPPPLVRRRGDLERGARAYKDLNRLALGRVAPGGFFLTFSCSAAVDAKLFRQILFSASLEAGVRLSLLQPLAAGGDHPVAVTHPQGEYLKGWLACVRGEL